MDAKKLLAGIYSQLQRLELAISQYREILEDDPKNKETRLQLSTLLIRLKDFDLALQQLSILIADDPGLLIAHYYMGRINLERDEYPRAEKAFLRVLEINPDFLPALFDLAVLYDKTDRPDRAITCYKRILATSPTNTTASERLISLYYKTGTAYQESIIDIGDDTITVGSDTYGDILRRKDLGHGVSASPSLHVGKKKGARVILQTSTGEILEIDEHNLPEAYKSRPINWIQSSN